MQRFRVDRGALRYQPLRAGGRPAQGSRRFQDGQQPHARVFAPCAGLAGTCLAAGFPGYAAAGPDPQRTSAGGSADQAGAGAAGGARLAPVRPLSHRRDQTPAGEIRPWLAGRKDRSRRVRSRPGFRHGGASQRAHAGARSVHQQPDGPRPRGQARSRDRARGGDPPACCRRSRKRYCSAWRRARR